MYVCCELRGCGRGRAFVTSTVRRTRTRSLVGLALLTRFDEEGEGFRCRAAIRGLRVVVLGPPVLEVCTPRKRRRRALGRKTARQVDMGDVSILAAASVGENGHGQGERETADSEGGEESESRSRGLSRR